jgi:hypothetical protein
LAIEKVVLLRSVRASKRPERIGEVEMGDGALGFGACDGLEDGDGVSVVARLLQKIAVVVERGKIVLRVQLLCLPDGEPTLRPRRRRTHN